MSSLPNCYSIEGLDLSVFDCVYSPAKRRGPIPRGASARKASEMSLGAGSVPEQAGANASWGTPTQPKSSMTNLLLHQVMAGRNTAGMAMNAAMNQNRQQQVIYNNSNPNLLQQQQPNKREIDLPEQAPARRAKIEPTTASGVPRTIAQHTQLLHRGNPEGGRLYSYYMLSIDELYRLPPTPTHEEYAARLGTTADGLPGTHVAALTASAFAEIALGALVSNEVSLAMELCNAVVHCLRESVQEPVQIPITFEVAKAYFLLGIFRALRGDMARYFKYRRVCLTYLTKIEVSCVDVILCCPTSLSI